MDVKHAFVVILLMKQTLTTVYYSYYKRNYTDSVSFCENNGGQLLRYGKQFVTAVHTCENSTGQVIFWTGHPHYTMLDCTDDESSNQYKNIPDNHFANCADFCDDDVYTYIGITGAACACYYKKPTIKECGTTPIIQCPGNKWETCGQHTMFVVYLKENNTPCTYRNYANASANGVGGKVTGSCDSILNNFFCTVGSDNDTNCDIGSIPSITTTAEFSKSTQESSTSNTLEGNTSSTITESTSVGMVTKMEQIPPNDTQNIGLFIGVAVAAVVLLTVIIIIICRRIRKKSPLSNGERPEKAVTFQKKSSAESDNDLGTNMSRGNQQSFMYDTAFVGNKTITNDDPDNSVYDSAAQNKNNTTINKTEQEYGCLSKPEGVYDSATQREKKKLKSTPTDDLNIYDYRGTTEGLYDSAANQQMLQKPHSEESEYGCAVKPEGIYDAAGSQSLMTSSLPSDNIYDHNSDLIYVTNEDKSGSGVTDIYDHT